jgi:hypothetical protein
MKLFRKLAAFIRRRYIALVTLYATFLALKLDKSLQCLVKLGAVDLGDPLFTIRAAPRPAQPTLATTASVPERKQIQIPYVPAWVAASFKDPTRHPNFQGRHLVLTPSGLIDPTATPEPASNPAVEATATEGVVHESPARLEETNPNK